jgi:predicted permease
MLNDLLFRLRSLFRRARLEHELDEEMRFHLDQQIAAYVRQGLARDEAVRRATIAFGRLDVIREEHRDARGITVIAHLGRDLRLAVRQVRRAPTFTALAVLCLGLGIGVNTSIFAVLNAVMFRSMGVQDPARLVAIGRGAEDTFPFSLPTYRAFAERNRTMSGLTASMPSESDLDVDGNSQFVAVEAVFGNYGAVMGIRTVLGRWFVDDNEPAAVISDALWRRRFELSRRRPGPPHQIGIGDLHHRRRRRSGVQRRLFTDPHRPLGADPHSAGVSARTRRPERATVDALRTACPGRHARASSRRAHRSSVTARQRRGPSLGGGAGHHREGGPGHHRSDQPSRSQVIATFLSIVVGLVLLIACVNVANLLLVRGAVRQREFAVRRALGASRGRLLQQLLAESLVVAAGGGICGLVMARWTTAVLQRSLPLIQGMWQAQLDFSLDWGVIGYATLISLATTILCGLLPAWRASQTSALVAFKGEIASGQPRRRPLGLVAQVVMSFVLLVVSGTFIEALLRMQLADPGFAVEGRLYAFTYVSTPGITPADGRLIYANALDQLKALPGVRHATISDSLPLLSNGTDCVSAGTIAPRQVNVYAVQSGYFETMNIRMIEGSDFAPGDRATDASAVIVNDRLARTLWPNTRAVGQQLVDGMQQQTDRNGHRRRQ